VDHNIYKKRLGQDGKAIAIEKGDLDASKPVVEVEKPANYCGSCYGSESVPDQCCNNCAEVRESYRKKG